MGVERCSPYRNLDVDESADLVRSGKTTCFNFAAYNNASSVRYLKLYDKATAATVGTDTPVLTYALPAGGGISISSPTGLNFNNGVSVGATTGVADNDTGAPSANDVVFNALMS